MQDLQRYMYRLVQRTILQEISMQTLLSSMCLDYEILSLVLLKWFIFWYDVIKVNPRKTSAFPKYLLIESKLIINFFMMNII